MGDIVDKIEFWQTYSITVGGLSLAVGAILKEGQGNTTPYLYAAALSYKDLEREQCGYGETEAGAVADLFRLMRPGTPSIGSFGF